MTEFSRPPDHPGFAWRRRDCADSPFNLSITLSSGQSFRWRQDLQGVWWGVIERMVVAAWQAEGQPDSPLYWQTFPQNDREDVIREYFRLNVNLDALYADWIAAEPRIAEAVAAFRGLRILRQPPLECFFAFQCAVCNTVVKIERSVRKLAERYGEPIDEGVEASGCSGVLEEAASYSIIENRKSKIQRFDASTPFFAFPTLDALANAEEAALRADLWGYRAPRVIALARHLQTLPPDWLTSLRRVSYREAHDALSSLYGVGAKLADCFCLFALDKDEATPVDTHIRQIACRLFLPELAEKSLTPRVYEAIAQAYHDRFGAQAGWAQQYLFFAALRRTI